LRDIPVFDHVEILAEYTDGSMVTVPSTTTVSAVVCPSCGASVFLLEATDAGAIPRSWLPVRDPEVLAQGLKTLNCVPGQAALRWHIACIQILNESCRSRNESLNTAKSPEWTYLNTWVANFANLEFADDASDVAEAYRRLGRFDECLLSLQAGKVVNRSRAQKIEQLALNRQTELEVV
jgi:hypothetical protein